MSSRRHKYGVIKGDQAWYTKAWKVISVLKFSRSRRQRQPVPGCLVLRKSEHVSWLSIKPKQVDFKSKLTKTFVGTTVGLADASANITTKHARTNDLIFKDVEVSFACIFRVQKCLSRSTTFRRSQWECSTRNLRVTAFVISWNYVVFQNGSQIRANEN